jgi:anti-sigma28 factor (negative regulator of flagellin synthesis)
MNNPIIATDQDGKQTTREFQTMFIHPISAFVVYNNSQKALGYAFSLYSEDGIHNGKGDAFRHALWNAMNTRDLGKVIAKKYADAHEDYKGNPTGEKNMDLKNNEIGREIGENNPKASDHELIKIIKERLENGELQLAPTNKTQKTEHPYMKKDYNYNGVEDVKTNK